MNPLLRYFLLAALLAGAAPAGAQTCSAGATCRPAPISCVGTTGPIGVGPYSQISYTPAHPTSETSVTAQAKYSGTEWPYDLPALVEMQGATVRLYVAMTGFSGVPLPERVCFFDIGRLPVGTYTLELWPSSSSGYTRASAVPLAIGEPLPVPAVTNVGLLVLALLLSASAFTVRRDR